MPEALASVVVAQTGLSELRQHRLDPGDGLLGLTVQRPHHNLEAVALEVPTTKLVRVELAGPEGDRRVAKVLEGRVHGPGVGRGHTDPLARERVAIFETRDPDLDPRHTQLLGDDPQGVLCVQAPLAHGHEHVPGLAVGGVGRDLVHTKILRPTAQATADPHKGR